MADRRYTDQEIEAIFARATEVQSATPRQLPSTEGMSLVELQSIGREAGIAPELVAEAARALDQEHTPPTKTLLGLPVAVAHTVELGRRLSDDEWEQLVVRCRETFDARGRVTAEGSFRQWTNGNLQVLLEPSGDGHRVRFRTLNANSRMWVGMGIGLFAVGTISVAQLMVSGGATLGAAMADVGWLGLMGAGFAAFGALRLPSWARTRHEQMRRLGAKLLGAG
jgi:hypothetical protein